MEIVGRIQTEGRMEITGRKGSKKENEGSWKIKVTGRTEIVRRMEIEGELIY
jgi:hypothetical protein